MGFVGEINCLYTWLRVTFRGENVSYMLHTANSSNSYHAIIDKWLLHHLEQSICHGTAGIMSNDRVAL